ncbi:uncharacterized protein LOC118205506 [Stegodyphus dumicola]|uniref:uncharacterized protein LOC118205506 n=1 Tax=Stegodyphus dumicola TaxID=202533 RepID=UPI0015AA47E6|nr:uncharacterized protein LOC118205506 [Stegodyphus dumicola]
MDDLETLKQKRKAIRSKKGCTEEEYEREFSAAQEYYDKLSTLKVKENRKKDKCSQPSTGSPNSSSSSGIVTAAKQKLPEIELVKFDGDSRKWLTFWTRFSKIHEDTRIDKRDKFHYLLQSTKPETAPRAIVESFPATEENYEKAVKYLKERFGNENVLIQIYVRELLKLVINDKQKIDLLTLYDKLQTQLRALESLGLTKDKFAVVLFPLVESALPADLIQFWERQRGMSPETTGKNDLESLIDFLKREVEIEFRVKLTHDVWGSDKVSNKKNKFFDTIPVVPTACELINANSSKCNVDNFQKFWKSNIRSVVPEEDSSTEGDVSVLGLVWHTVTDTLSWKISQDIKLDDPVTKRLVLAVAHQVFDVIGHTAPVMLISKLILQETWNLRLKWDDILPDELTKKYRFWLKKLYLLSSIQIPRYVGLKSINEAEIRSLTSPTVWRHVPGSLNPADLLSRGCYADQLIERKWWEGPDWLREDEANWPKSNDEPDEDLVNSEIREIVLLEDQNKNRAYWNLARVIRVIPGRDGNIRVALVKSNNSEFLRPIQRLFRLELDNIIDNTQNEQVPFTTSSGRVVKSQIM